MSLYYSDEYVELWHGDCLTEHREWLDAHVLVTDPPYGMDYRGFGGRGYWNDASKHKGIHGDKSTTVRDDALALWSAEAPDRPALVFGRWNIERPRGVRERLIWDKTPCGFMGDTKMPWGSAEEEIYVIGSGFVGKREANLLRSRTYNSQDADRPDHPTPKPVGLMELLIAKCPPGALADPFAGSGATLIAAKNLRRQVVGVELDEKHCETIAKRLSQDVLDLEWTA